MSWRRRMEHGRLRERAERGDPLWPPQLAIAVVIALNLALAGEVSVGPTWLLPSVEAVLLAALIVVAPARATAHEGSRRHFALAVIGVVSAVNLVSLGALVDLLVTGGKLGGQRLVLSGALLWVNNVLLFAVWYWEMDRGGPLARHRGEATMPDFRFPQMENPELAPAHWSPGFGDYLYTSLTNATAFSPTDVMPLTLSAKVLMAAQSVGALLTLALVVARAVNVLG